MAGFRGVYISGVSGARIRYAVTLLWNTILGFFFWRFHAFSFVACLSRRSKSSFFGANLGGCPVLLEIGVYWV